MKSQQVGLNPEVPSLDSAAQSNTVQGVSNSEKQAQLQANPQTPFIITKTTPKNLMAVVAKEVAVNVVDAKTKEDKFNRTS